METCKNCRFWETQAKTKGECAIVGTDGADSFEIEVQVDDNSNLRVGLVTGPDFGCVHHQPK